MDIERAAIEAGLDAWDVWRKPDGTLCVTVDSIGIADELEKFARLMRHDERMRCARIAWDIGGDRCEKLVEAITERPLEEFLNEDT